MKINQIRRKFSESCIIEGRINKKGCRIGLKEFPPDKFIVDLDKKGSPKTANEPSCDYVIFTSDKNVNCFALELKRGSLEASEAIKQFQASASLIQRFIEKDSISGFYPCAAHGNIKKRQREELKKPSNRIKFFGKKIPVRLIRCNGSLHYHSISQRLM